MDSSAVGAIGTGRMTELGWQDDSATSYQIRNLLI